jgi:hypothetical protein
MSAIPSCFRSRFFSIGSKDIVLEDIVPGIVGVPGMAFVQNQNVWTVGGRSELRHRTDDLAPFNLASDSKIVVSR